MDREEALLRVTEELHKLREDFSGLSNQQLKVTAATALFAFTEKTGPGETGVVMAEILATLFLAFTTLYDEPEELDKCLEEFIRTVKLRMQTMYDEDPPPSLQ